MPYLTWLADVLRDGGLSVREIPGWETRAVAPMKDIRGCLLHHTAGPQTGDFPSERVLVEGRLGLPGPLANLGLTRAGVWVIVAAGSANHAGKGSISWCPTDQGNQHLIGIEAESTGRGDWTPAQLETYPRGVAALLNHLDLPASRAIGHREWAPTRKIDPYGWPDGMPGFRAQVTRWMQEDDMPSPDDIRKIVREELAAALKVVATRDDVGWARLQVLTELGHPDPAKAPGKGGRGSKLDQILELLRDPD